MSSEHCTISKVERQYREQFVQKYREKHLVKKNQYSGQIHQSIYTCIQSTRGNNSSQQTKTQLLNSNISNHSH